MRPRLVFLSQHNRNHALGEIGIGRIRRVEASVLIVIVDLENDGCAIEIEHSKVVLVIWVVRGAKIIKAGDSVGQASNCFLAECRDTGGHQDAAVVQVPSQIVGERTYFFPVRAHGFLRSDDGLGGPAQNVADGGSFGLEGPGRSPDRDSEAQRCRRRAKLR